MQLNDFSGYIIASPKSGRKPSQVSAESKTFPLEGRNNVLFEAVESLATTPPGGPTYPTLGKRLFPALDAAEQTVAALGKKPTPEEVDRSNLRRLIRATEPLMETYRDCYPPKDFKKAKKELKAVARAMGQYKDIAVVEAEVAAANGGVIPKDVAKAIAKSREKRAENFKDAYKRFRKKGLPAAVEILRQPRMVGIPDPQKLLKEDKKRLSSAVSEHLGRTASHGMHHHDSENFHEARKSLRATLNAINAADRTVPVDGEAVNQATDLVDSYGRAQDAHIAESWLQQKGFIEQAAKLSERQRRLHQEALQQAAGFSLDSLRPG